MREGGIQQSYRVQISFFAAISFFVALVFGVDAAFARTNISASSVNITEDTVWTLDNSPYVISDHALLDVNATLTIEPGVVIKFIPNHYLRRYNGIKVSVGGKIIAQGTEENPIIFTSYYDDEYGGDTNGDGNASLASAGDWRGIIFDADESELSHVKILYAANIYESYGAIEAKNGSSLSVSNSVIQYCKGSCIRLNEPTSARFFDSIISDSADFGVYSTVSGSAPSFSGITIQNCASGIATLSAGNTVVFSNMSLLGNKNIINFTGSVISLDSVWPKIGDSAYILRNDIEISSDATLTIEPGVVVKGEYGEYPDSRLEIYGRLIARGTGDNPIIFTSFSDDSVAGDSNADAGATSPDQDDWGGLYFENSSGSILENVVARYGGRYLDDFSGVMYGTTNYNMIHLKNSSLSVATSTIGIAKTAIYLEGASQLTMSGSVVASTTTGILSSSSLGSSVSGSVFANNSQAAISNSGAQIIARNNWWQDNAGPYHADNVDGAGQAVVGDVVFDPWTGKAPDRVPVILVPGIMGTELYVGEDKIWPDLIQMIDPDDDFMNVLSLDTDGTPINAEVVVNDIVRKPVINKDVFLGLINKFTDQGYQENTDLFVFPYDWRLSSIITSESLKDKIDSVLSDTGSQAVDIIAHSMGGLLAKQYMLDNGNDSVNKIIFVGTPHLGATKA
ncbi:MAG: hypothetical protein CO042_02205, partial [Parcubacteria group bacterium CG_4_9_14_0_2_um_filter_41_8]